MPDDGTPRTGATNGDGHNGNGMRTAPRGKFFMTPNAYVDDFLPRTRSIAAVKAYQYLRRWEFVAGGSVTK